MSTYGNEEFIKLENLGQFAYDCGRTMTPGKPVSTFYTAKTAEKNLTTIKSVMQDAAAYAQAHVTIPQEVEWLLDNWYIAEREGKSAISDIKSSPKLKSTDKTRLVVGEAARALVSSGCGAVTGERIEVFLDAFQDAVFLSEAELSSFIPILRLALIEALACACKKLCHVINDGVVEDGLAPLLGRLFTALRFLSGFDASKILERVNRVERTLKLDPTGVYSEMDEQTRFLYRREIARLAEETSESEHHVAERVLLLSQSDSSHVGTYIFTKPLGLDKKRRTGASYVSLILLASLFIALLISFALDQPAISILLLLPVSEIVKNVVDYFVLKLFSPQRVPRLELEAGVPDEGRTLCVISVLLTSTDSGARAAGLLEEYRLLNRDAGPNLRFGILADLPDAAVPTLAEDEKVIRNAEEEIKRLNAIYGGGFFLFCRDRHYNARDRRYTSWERKRGAILELCRFLRGKASGMKCSAGIAEALAGTRYIIALDSDTRLCAGTARELIGSMLHPLNRPVVDTLHGIVTSGSGILQPRISVDLAAACQTDYTRVFAGQGGLDPYGGVTSDIYQNLFGTGSFSGKGIIDVDAYLGCLDNRFPENTVLSHDLLEGAYLRCGFAGDIELTDGYPAKVTTYYDRMHRWTRGDWQSLPWLKRRVKTADGNVQQNCLGQIDRWKIIDNLRRSLVPIFSFASIFLGMLLDNTDFVWAGLVAILAAASHLVIASTADIFRKNHGRVRYHSTVISGIGGQFIQTLVRLIFLPYEAWVCLNAIVTALYRMLISHRHLLAWVTAADSEKKTKNNFVAVLGRMWPVVVFSLIIVLFTHFPAAAAVGIVWALSPLLVIAISRDVRKKESLRPVDRLVLSRCAGDIWRYFEELLSPDDNFLPPDNFQEQPAVGVAHRTSPTNIGLALLSALAALDLGVTTREKAVGVISCIFETIKKLPKWNGHLYNWYDTTTLGILQPAYISTVDSGNFAGCLIALREGLKELGETALADTAQGLLSAMSFTPLFDEKRQLFYIGLDLTKNAPTEGWYDLLASEARQTSYLAIARGDVPRKHWRRLGRSLVAKDGYRGMASWTGTMFEYMMPELLLPCYQNSLIYESLKFCLYVQKKRADGIPWGMSESAFYAFDHALNYRYKAHGVQRLALKRGMGKEAVVSPYSTFLALQLDAKAAVRNIQRLQELGAEGRYGLYEAVDFTPNRLRSKDYEIVRTFMAHHLGMSLVAIDNVLRSGIMQRRFMRDREMAAFAELLQEKVPVGGIVLRQPPRDVPEKPVRLSSQSWGVSCDGIDYKNPRCTLLGNGAYNVIMAETGQSSSFWNGVTLTKTSFEPLGPDAGMSFYLSCGGELLPLLPSPVFDPQVRYSAELTGSCCKISAKSGSLSTSVTASVPENEAGELRTVEVLSTVQREAELICYFEPVLARQSDYDAHPAFSKLSLETMLHDNSVIVKRRPRAKGRGIALAFDASCPFSFDTSREKALGRGGIFALKSALAKEPSMSLGAVLDPCVLARVSLSLQPNVPYSVSLAVTTASTPQAASAAAKRILAVTEPAFYSRVDETAHRLGLSAEQLDRAMALLPLLIYHSPDRRIDAGLLPSLAKGQRGLWSLGVSGDLPIVTAAVESDGDIDASRELISWHRLLHDNGSAFDLVFLIRGGGDYRSTLRDALLDVLRKNDVEYRLGARGGIHLCDMASDAAGTVRAASAAFIPAGERLALPPRCEDMPPVTRPFSDAASGGALEYGYNSDNSFTFTINGQLPYNAWCHTLANEAFGYIATDAGTGHMWHLNARENKINRWLNDSLTTCGTETLKLVKDSAEISLFAAGDGLKCAVTYGFGWAEWKKTIDGATYTTTAFVPLDTAARVFIIEAADGAGLEVSYFTDLVLFPEASDGVYVKTSAEDGMLTAQNVYNVDFPDSVFRLAASSPVKSFTCSKNSALKGTYDGITGAGFVPCAAAVYRAVKSLVIVTGCDSPEKLRALADYAAARRKLRETTDYWACVATKLTVTTPDDGLNRYLNGWATYQTLACRIFGRSSLYQSGGAYGFRDQLQDICAVLDEAPEVARAHLLRAAAHQFEEGDVQHWWHPGANEENCGDKGVRTRCSDDLLWLPYALCEYIEKTGDRAVLGTPVRYLNSPPLNEDELERYEQPHLSGLSEPLLQHAVRAVDLVIARGTGCHGLCFIGSGDWNDGMNLVGAGGQGESVWLTWFAAITASRMAELCQGAGNPGAASRFLEAAAKFRADAENAWDGDWFMRGYYDDGAPLGSCASEECRIDSIAQSFAAFAGADPEKTKTALVSSVERLYDRDDRIVRLFDPPFENGGSTPGYIKGYSPGFRENGGQYTHGAVWLAMGLFMAGMKDEGLDILQALLPQGRPNEIYRTEPYVLAADVYSAPDHVGRGGWTWYTGAAGWYKRVALENLLGLRIKDGVLHVRPDLPGGWEGFEAVWRNGSRTYHILVKRGGRVTVTADGAPYSGGDVVIDEKLIPAGAENSQ
ncbi:cyclic beta-1,2-glucan synthetase [Sporobacter termitidis DSM 10068]|uniref:Cyclic beta-1,2-glucan synthetase n=1 Tax=Sporobacter termitidis DSM 10068 TaxID=1123282 RepID=A0A1M5TDY7_9FIRM|nr:glucoamylase family protein [Sporobacter termitidis]SHH48939.1 cyclic beta-1,2-glucan synthetase [Sporobacter termitidis DSM 10068]